MVIMKCTWCNWLGTDEELRRYVDDDEAYCPCCGRVENLYEVNAMDPDFLNIAGSNIADLWELFSEVSVDDDDLILEDFAGFEKGTNRFEILRWFQNTGYFPM